MFFHGKKRVLMGMRAHGCHARGAERERERARGLQTVRVQPITGQAEITEHNVNFTFIAPDQAFRN